MRIDIDSLTEDELRDLHHRITERLRIIHQLRAHSVMLEFAIGDRVMFNADGRRVSGVISRYNRKTVTVIAEGGHRWNVSPGLLSRVDSSPVNGGNPVVVTVKTANHAAPTDALARVGLDTGNRH